jgi:hypothetical protein
VRLHTVHTTVLHIVNCCCALQAELPDLLEALDGVSSASVPEGLLREIEEVNSIGGAQHLQEVRSAFVPGCCYLLAGPEGVTLLVDRAECKRVLLVSFFVNCMKPARVHVGVVCKGWAVAVCPRVQVICTQTLSAVSHTEHRMTCYPPG